MHPPCPPSFDLPVRTGCRSYIRGAHTSPMVVPAFYGIERTFSWLLSLPLPSSAGVHQNENPARVIFEVTPRAGSREPSCTGLGECLEGSTWETHGHAKRFLTAGSARQAHKALLRSQARRHHSLANALVTGSFSDMAFARLFSVDAIDAQDGDRVSDGGGSHMPRAARNWIR